MQADIAIFDFDSSITCQHLLVKEIKARTEIIELKQYKNMARLWMSPKHFELVANKMLATTAPFFSFIGSGDYHHLTLALVQRFKNPLTVVLFDNHPDWMRPPHQYHCGTWVYSLARLDHVKRIIIVGLESGDIEPERFAKGDVESFINQKIVLFPYLPVEIHLASMPSETIGSKLGTNLTAGIHEIMHAITTEDVYISIDKDCLRKEDAFTNWEQGTMPLKTVLRCISEIRKKFNVVGADTVGDYSSPKFFSPLKWIGSVLDRSSGAFNFRPKKAELMINERANIAIIDTLFT